MHRFPRLFRAFAVASLTLSAACGGATEQISFGPGDGSASGSVDGSSNGAVDAGADSFAPDSFVPDSFVPDSGSFASGRCATNADCPGGTCVELVPGGFRVCAHPAPPPEPCTDAGPVADECCGACDAGTCTLETFCGGAYTNPHNVCAIDECATNDDCGVNGICLPVGVGHPYQRTCLRSNDECLHDADCKLVASGGKCVMPGLMGPLTVCAPYACNGVTYAPANPLRCQYEGSCSDDSACPPTQHCEEFRCAPGARPGCPLPP